MAGECVQCHWMDVAVLGEGVTGSRAAVSQAATSDIVIPSFLLSFHKTRCGSCNRGKAKPSLGANNQSNSIKFSDF